MESVENKSYHTLAALIHLSSFSKYFIPLGNFIFPLIIWSIKTKPIIDRHGKEALNFQLSIFFYMVLLIAVTVVAGLFIAANSGIDYMAFPEDIFRISRFTDAFPFLVLLTIGGVLLLGLFILELVCVISATVKASEGKDYQYPLTINFIKSSNQSQNEQFNNIQNETL